MIRLSKPILSAVLMGSLLIVAGPKALATAGPTTHWVATSGTTIGTGTSCSNPGYVGTDQAPITAALSAAGVGDTVRVCSGRYLYTGNGFENSLPSGVSLVGSDKGDTILDGNNLYFLLYIYDTEQFTLKNLTLTRGRDWYAAAIGFWNARVAIVDSNFEDNHTHTAGGAAIHLENASELTVIRSAFVGNTSATSGAGIDVHADGTPTTLSIIDSVFTRNTAQTTGGAIHTSSSTVLTVRNSQFRDNSAESAGAISSSGPNDSIIASAFFSNQALLGDGGAVLASNYLRVSASAFTANQAIRGGAIWAADTFIQRSQFVQNASVERGGGIFLSGGTLDMLQRLRGNRFSRNRSGAGGALSVELCERFSRRQFTAVMRSNRFHANRATEQRGTGDVQMLQDDCET